MKIYFFVAAAIIQCYAWGYSSVVKRKDSYQNTTFNYSKYNNYDEITHELHRLSKTNQRKVKVKNLGKTFEGRKILCVEISKHPTSGKDKKRKRIVVECGAHAREWISPATCMKLIQNFMNVSKPESNKIIENFDITIIPVLNPDGYAYTWRNKTTRGWRKNRSVKKGQHCIGVDVNRNFPEAWGGAGSSPSPCSNLYRGTHLLSEKEPQALVKYMTKIKNDVIVYLCLHSFGQTLSTPWGYTSEKPKDFDDLAKVGRTARDAIKKVYGTKYSVGNAHNFIYASSGNIVDYLHAQLGIKYTYFIEMRPKKKEFVVPESIMLKNAEEMFAGMVAVADELKDET